LTIAETVRAILRARAAARLTADEQRAAVRALRRFERHCYVVAVTTRSSLACADRFRSSVEPVWPVSLIPASCSSEGRGRAIAGAAKPQPFVQPSLITLPLSLARVPGRVAAF
jgi:hypothetical protein